MNAPPSTSLDKLTALVDGMVAWRTEICPEHALTVNHQHTIGCVLVMDYMQKHHPNLAYGTQAQWIEEAGFCTLHERQIFIEFLRSRGIGV